MVKLFYMKLDIEFCRNLLIHPNSGWNWTTMASTSHKVISLKKYYVGNTRVVNPNSVEPNQLQDPPLWRQYPARQTQTPKPQKGRRPQTILTSLALFTMVKCQIVTRASELLRVYLLTCFCFRYRFVHSLQSDSKIFALHQQRYRFRLRYQLELYLKLNGVTVNFCATLN